MTLHPAPDNHTIEPLPAPAVLLVAGEYPPAMGGVGDYTALLAHHLVAQGTRVSVLTGGRVEEATDGEAGIRVLRSSGRWGVECWKEISDAAKALACDIVHIQYQAAAFGLKGAVNLLPGYLRRTSPATRVITTLHDLRIPYLFPKAGPLRRGAVLALDRLSHATVVTNSADLEELGGKRSRRSGAPRRWLIPLASSVAASPPSGYERARWRKTRLLAGDRDLVLGYYGFMNDSKGVDTLVDALAQLVARGVPSRLVLVGGEVGDSDPTNRAYAERVRGMIEGNGLANQVIWTGFATPEEVSGHLLATDICVLPFQDGASLRRSSLLTAVEHGLPIVTTLPQRPEPLLRDRDNVVMVGPGEPRALADAVEFLWHEDQLRSRLAAGALALSGRFRWSDIAAEHIRLYRTVLRSAT